MLLKRGDERGIFLELEGVKKSVRGLVKLSTLEEERGEKSGIQCEAKEKPVSNWKSCTSSHVCSTVPDRFVMCGGGEEKYLNRWTCSEKSTKHLVWNSSSLDSYFFRLSAYIFVCLG